MLYLTLYIYGFKSIENKVNCCIISQSLHWYSFMENVYNYTINDVYENVILIYTRGRHHNPTRASALLAISYHGQCRIKAFVGNANTGGCRSWRCGHTSLLSFSSSFPHFSPLYYIPYLFPTLHSFPVPILPPFPSFPYISPFVQLAVWGAL